MKWLVLASFLSLNAFAAEPLDYSCEVEKGHQTFLVATKENKNVIHIALKIDPTTCRIPNDKDIMNIYWKVGEKVKNGVTPCQKISRFEKNFFSLEESDITKKSDVLAVIKYADLKKQGEKFGRHLSEEIELEVFRGRNHICEIRTKIFADSRPLVIDRIHNNISFFTLKSVEFYNGIKKVLTLK